MDLACSRGERRLFAGLGFALHSGRALTVTGPNGAGKTTLLRVLAGFLRADGGEIVLEGTSDDFTLAGAMHFIGHRDGLKNALTLRENLALAPAFYGSSGLSPEDACRTLDLAPLLDLPVAVLSAGQRRRGALARLLVADRPIWLLDEPTAALDAASTRAVIALLKGHAARGGIVIAATHLALELGGTGLTLSADGSHRLADLRP
jgi:heme exporter protein A